MQPKAKIVICNGLKEPLSRLLIIEPLYPGLSSVSARDDVDRQIILDKCFDREPRFLEGPDFRFYASRQLIAPVMEYIHVVGQARPLLVQGRAATNVILFGPELAQSFYDQPLNFSKGHYLAKLLICLPSL